MTKNMSHMQLPSKRRETISYRQLPQVTRRNSNRLTSILKQSKKHSKSSNKVTFKEYDPNEQLEEERRKKQEEEDRKNEEEKEEMKLDDSSGDNEEIEKECPICFAFMAEPIKL